MILTSMLRIGLTRSVKPFVFYGKAYNQLKFENEDALGLYVHIPFCKSICSFCPYNKELYNQAKALQYKYALLSEFDIVCSSLTQKKRVTSLYFGGGTPALMSADLGEIIAKLHEYFIIADGIGVELHPDDVNPKTLAELKAAGVTMVSIGIQSFNENCLAKIGRVYKAFEEKIKLAADYGFSVIDVDLIFGIPGQTEEILRSDIWGALQNGATQVSTYPFIDFTFATNTYKPLPESKKKRMLKALVSICKEFEIERTSVWTFAKKGTDKYSSVTRSNFLGFGPSATTLLTNSFKINTFSVDAYIETVGKHKLPTALTLDFTARQRAAYYLFWSAYGLRVDENDFQRVMGESLAKMYGLELWLARRIGLLKRVNSGYALTERASFLYHHIEQAYTTAYIDKMWNIARKEPFPKKICLK